MPPSGLEIDRQASADEVRPLSHEPQPEAAGTARRSSLRGIEPAPIIRDLQDPVAPDLAGGCATVTRPACATRPASVPACGRVLTQARDDPDVARVRVAPDVLECLLDDPEDDGLLGISQGVRRRREVYVDFRARSVGQAVRMVADRSIEPDLVEEGRAQLGDEGPDVGQLAAQAIAEEPHLATRRRRVAILEPLDVLDLEDRVGQRLCRPIMNLLRQPLPFCLLRLDHADLDVRGQLGVASRHERVVTVVEEMLRSLKVGGGQLQFRQVGLPALAPELPRRTLPADGAQLAVALHRGAQLAGSSADEASSLLVLFLEAARARLGAEFTLH